MKYGPVAKVQVIGLLLASTAVRFAAALHAAHGQAGRSGEAGGDAPQDSKSHSKGFLSDWTEPGSWALPLASFSQVTAEVPGPFEAAGLSQLAAAADGRAAPAEGRSEGFLSELVEGAALGQWTPPFTGFSQLGAPAHIPGSSTDRMLNPPPAEGAAAAAPPPPQSTASGGPASVPSRRQGMYFRPVSVTLYCVMLLTIVCVGVYTAVAVARNTDAFSGNVQPSEVTQVLSVAARVLAYPPMLCMLMVACRMYILATTEGLGEPPKWVKGCMVLATTGMLLQFLIPLVLPLFTSHYGPDGSDKATRLPGFEVLSGEPADVQIRLDCHRYTDAWMRYFLQGTQFLTTLLIYVGIVGIIMGIVLFPPQTTEVSFAVICTIMLSLLYFSIFSILVVAHSLGSDGAGRLRPAALQAIRSVRKAPMLAVFFLAARMRALQLDPPHGVPPPWAQTAFIVNVAALSVETIIGLYIGATGKELRGYYGLCTYKSSWFAHVLLSIATFSGFVCLVPLVASIFSMETAAGEAAPLSTTMVSVLELCGLFFFIQFLDWVAHTAQDMFDYSVEKFRATVMAADVSVRFAPLLCILFVGCRMRALQITQQLGEPPPWAQLSMLICVWATGIQCVSCLLMPLFTGGNSTADGDGMGEFELKPMLGAYTVSIVKFIALFALHLGVLSICAAVMTMTPDTARADVGAKERMKAYLWYLGVALIVVLVSLVLSSAKVVGLAVKWAVESIDMPTLGTEVHVGAAAISLWHGFVSIAHTVVENPAASGQHKWESPYLIKVDKMLVKLNMGRLIHSLAKQIEVEHFTLQGVEINYERDPGGPANVQRVIDHLTGVVPAQPEEPKEPAKPEEPAADQPPPDVDAFIHRVEVTGIEAHVLSSTFLGNLSLALGDIVYEDLDDKIRGKNKTKSLSVAAIAKEASKIIALTLLKTLMANMMGIGGAKETLRTAGRVAAEGCNSCCGGSVTKKTPTPAGTGGTEVETAANKKRLQA